MAIQSETAPAAQTRPHGLLYSPPSRSTETAVTVYDNRSEFLHVRGLRLHVRRWGDDRAPMLFLCHGWLDVSATFAPVAAILAERWQVLAPDARGFGHS